MRKYFLPLILILFTLLSLTTLRSIVPELLLKQTFAFVLAFVVFVVAGRLPFTMHLQLAKWLYVGLNVLLLFLLIYGQITRGISAWLILPFGFKFQPSQLAVPIVVLYVATFFSQARTFSWPLLLKTLLVIVLPAVLILLEPDFGTVLVFVVASLMALYLNQLTTRQWIALAVSALALALGLWFVVLQGYQKARLLNFFHLQANEQSVATVADKESNSSYNARQALIAVGSGRMWGRGIGQGVQSHLRFLPERQTDFIFASFAEEWGLLGAGFLLLLYLLLLLFLLYMAWQTVSFPAQLYLLSIFTMLLVQIFINVGMNMAVLPITGITLPLMSYGGSSVIGLFYALGVAQAIISSHQKRELLWVH